MGRVCGGAVGTSGCRACASGDVSADVASRRLSQARCAVVGRASRGSEEETLSSSVVIALGTRTVGGATPIVFIPFFMAVSCSEVPGNCRQASAICEADRASIVAFLEFGVKSFMVTWASEWL